MALFEDLRDTLTELNAIGDQISAPGNEEIDVQLNLTRALRQQLDRLSPKAVAVDAALNMPARFIQRPAVPKKMAERINELQAALDERERNLQQLAQLRAVAPEIVTVNEKLDVQFERLTQSMPETLEQQQSLLHEFEKEKRRLEETITALPSGEEADALRERSQWNLSRLKDWLKRLADAVGDRLAILAAFNATRDDIDRRIGDLRIQIRSIKPETDHGTSVMFEENIRHLEVDLSQYTNFYQRCFCRAMLNN
jgi:hypothetical protein